MYIQVLIIHKPDNCPVSDYIETVEDSDFPERPDWRVFGKKYSCQDVYIKIRVELLNVKGNGESDSIFVMSFHFAEYDFSENDFPHRKNGGELV